MSIHQTDLGVDGGEIRVEHDDDVVFSREAELRFASQWADIQSRFVDDPRAAVACADDPADTEEVRLAVQRYRDLFHRLLSI